jgi:hypothetical protein
MGLNNNTGNGLRHIQFVACFGIKMFKKRMLMTQELSVEFVAESTDHVFLSVPHADTPVLAGRIWLLRVQAVPDGRWCIVKSFVQHSSPACLDVALALGVHLNSGCATPPQHVQMPDIDRTGVLTSIGYIV